MKKADARKHARQPSSEEIQVSLQILDLRETKQVRSQATAIDISPAGARIKTQVALEPGQVIWFSRGIEMQLSMVKWVVHEDSYYFAGLMHV